MLFLVDAALVHGLSFTAQTSVRRRDLGSIMPRSRSTIPWVIGIMLTLWQGADSRSKLGCGTDRVTEYEALAQRTGKQVVTVAVAQYGLLRNNCSAYVYERLFAQLPTSKKYVYIVDHFMHSNELFGGHEGKYRKVSTTKIAGGDPAKETIDLFIFEDFPACRFATTPQEFVDMQIEPQMAGTCNKYGDYWGDKTCGVTLNYLRGLYSQKQVHGMIVAHEHTRKQKYDIVVMLRPDVLFTRQLNLKYFDSAADGLFGKPQKAILFTPSWSTWGGANDRFMLGARGSVMHALQRLDYTVAYCARKNGKLHSETFLKWVITNYTQWENAVTKAEGGTPKLVEWQVVHAFFFRRLRATSALVGAQYLNKRMQRLPVDSIPYCTKEEVDKMMREWAPIVDVLSPAYPESVGVQENRLSRWRIPTPFGH